MAHNDIAKQIQQINDGLSNMEQLLDNPSYENMERVDELLSEYEQLVANTSKKTISSISQKKEYDLLKMTSQLKGLCEITKSKDFSKRDRSEAAKFVIKSILAHLKIGKNLPDPLNKYLINAIETGDELSLGLKSFSQHPLEGVYGLKMAAMVRVQTNNPDRSFHGDSLSYVAEKFGYSRSFVYYMCKKYERIIGIYENKYSLMEMPTNEDLIRFTSWLTDEIEAFTSKEQLKQ